MEDYISISTLNDFIFCPYSIYLHNVYMEADETMHLKLWVKRLQVTRQMIFCHCLSILKSMDVRKRWALHRDTDVVYF